MSDTVYRIVADGGDHGFRTDDVEEAESWSEAGADVYAVSGGMGMNRRDIALMDDGEVAALVTITPMARGGDEVAADARELLGEAFETEATPVEVGRDE